MKSASEYRYANAEATHDDRFLWRALCRALLKHAPPPASVFELGCGNGVNARRIAALDGYSVTATDSSTSAIAAARSIPGSIRFEVADVYDPLHERFGKFDVVVALEVIEHLYAPRALVRLVRDLLNPGGCAFLSTPYHGWLKNVVIAAAGRFDRHVDPLWDNGHIKFFSPATLRRLLAETGLREVELQRVGRVPMLARSMLMIAQRTAAE